MSRLFNDTKGFELEGNAILKLERVLGDSFGAEYNWVIVTNSQGRFVPVIVGHRKGYCVKNLVGLLGLHHI